MRNAKRTKSSFAAWMFFMSPDEKVRKAKPAAVPNRTFMVGPAKQAATAIFGRPSRATVRLAMKSPTELPHAGRWRRARLRDAADFTRGGE